MAQLDRLESLAGRGQKRTMIVMPDQPGFLELLGIPRWRPVPIGALRGNRERRLAAKVRRRLPCQRDRSGCASRQPPRSATSLRPRCLAAPPIAFGLMPTSIKTPAPSPQIRVEFPRDPLASTANWTAMRTYTSCNDRLSDREWMSETWTATGGAPHVMAGDRRSVFSRNRTSLGWRGAFEQDEPPAQLALSSARNSRTTVSTGVRLCTISAFNG